MTAQFSSQVADAISSLTIAQVLLFDLESGSSLDSLTRGLVAAAIPLVVAGPIAGYIADSKPRQATLVVGHLLRALVTLGALLSTVTDHRIAGFACLGILMGLSRILYTARATSIPALVRKHELVAADSISLTLGFVAGLVGGLFASVISRGQPEAALAMAALLHIFAAFKYRLITLALGGGKSCGNESVETETPSRRSALRQLCGAKVRFVMLTTGAHRLLLGACIASVALIVDAHFHLEASGYAAVIGITAIGSFIGSLTAEWLVEHFPRRSIAIICFAAAGLAMLIAAASSEPAVTLGSMAIGSFCFQNLRLRSDATIQANSSDSQVGRVFAAYDMFYNFAFVIGGIVGVVLTKQIDAGATLAVMAVLYIVTAIAIKASSFEAESTQSAASSNTAMQEPVLTVA